MNVGDRVGAIFGTHDNRVSFFGYGVYVGEEVPTEAVGFLADNLRECSGRNPKIQLDSGQTVYGCECWWAPEERIELKLERYRTLGFLIVDVDIEQIRKDFYETSARK